MLRKIGFALVAIALVYFGARALIRGFASDETKIRTGLEAACKGFSDARMNPILEFLARDFREETTGFDRENLRTVVVGAFMSEKDPVTRGFPYRAAVVPDSLVIDVEKPAATKASIAFKVRITDMRGDGERTAWEFHVDGTMRKGDDGWQMSRAKHDTDAGHWTLK